VTTRAIFVSFSVYNHHYDAWAAVQLTIEMPPSGFVVTSHHVRPFVPNLFETGHEYVITYIIFFRLLIAGYIAVVVSITERGHKTRNQKAGFRYYTSVNGLCDVASASCVVATMAMRFAKFNGVGTTELIKKMQDVDKTTGFLCFMDTAHAYEWLFILESAIFGITMLRLVSLARINRTVYLLWHTLGRTLTQGMYLCLLFVPTIFFFTLIAHRIWGANSMDFLTLSKSVISVFHMTKGALDVSQLVRLDTLLAAFYYFLLYIFVTFLLITGFALVFIESYYVVQLTCTAQGETWNYEKWKNWLVHPVLLSLFHFAVKGSPSPPDGG